MKEKYLNRGTYFKYTACWNLALHFRFDNLIYQFVVLFLLIEPLIDGQNFAIVPNNFNIYSN